MIDSACLPGRMRHAGELLPSIQQLLARQEWPVESLTDVFVSIGPGSFTGLRIAVSVARTLAWSLNVRITAVPTVDVLARNALLAAPPPEHVAVVLDAKRSQVYAAAFSLQADAYHKTADAQLTDPAAFLRACPQPLAILGEGIGYHRAAIDACGVHVLAPELWWPRAEHVYQVGQVLCRQGICTPGNDLMPLYIRRPEAEEKWEQLHGASQG